MSADGDSVRRGLSRAILPSEEAYAALARLEAVETELAKVHYTDAAVEAQEERAEAAEAERDEAIRLGQVLQDEIQRLREAGTQLALACEHLSRDQAAAALVMWRGALAGSGDD